LEPAFRVTLEGWVRIVGRLAWPTDRCPTPEAVPLPREASAPGIAEFGRISGSPTIRWVSMMRGSFPAFADATALGRNDTPSTTRTVETIGATLHKRLGVLTLTSPVCHA
jgi:hypothetical protein